MCRWNPASSYILHIHVLEILLQKLDVKCDGEMIVSLLNTLGDSLTPLDDGLSIGSLIPTPRMQGIFVNAARGTYPPLSSENSPTEF